MNNTYVKKKSLDSVFNVFILYINILKITLYVHCMCLCFLSSKTLNKQGYS